MHIIRLRGPWKVEPVARFVPQADGTYRPVKENLPAGGRAKMPADWSAMMGLDFYGRVRYVRTFNKPTGLESGERVFLVVKPPRSCGLVRVNDNELGRVRYGAPPGRFDITSLLVDHNSVVIDVEHPELEADGIATDDGGLYLAGGLVGEVRLEIAEE